jgi:hypothetical protein
MVALTRDFHVFTSRVSASFSTVFFSAGYIAKTRYVRALFRLLIRHCNSILSNSDPPAPITEATCDSWRSAVPCTDRGVSRESSRRSGFGNYFISSDCIQLSKRRDAAKPMRSKVVRLAT